LLEFESMFSISVIIPVYNAEKFLIRAIESVLIQPEVTEIILIEDNSPDNCYEICREFSAKDPKVKLYCHEGRQNRGAGESRNLGIKKATNEFIAFLDADDYYLSNRFKNDREIFKTRKDIDGVYNAIAPYAIDNFGKARLKHIENLMTMSEIVSPKELFYKMDPIGSSGFFSLNGFTVKRESLFDVGLFDKTLRLSQDTHFFIKLAAKKNLISGILETPVAMYALHEHNRSHDLDKIQLTRPYLFYSLYKWGVSEKLDTDKIYLLWKMYYIYAKSVYGMVNRIDQLKLLSKSFIENPGIIRSKFYRNQLPIFGRF